MRSVQQQRMHLIKRHTWLSPYLSVIIAPTFARMTAIMTRSNAVELISL